MPFIRNVPLARAAKADGSPWSPEDDANLLRQDPAPVGGYDIDPRAIVTMTPHRPAPIAGSGATEFQREQERRATESGDQLQPSPLPADLREYLVRHGQVTLADVLMGRSPTQCGSAMMPGTAQAWLDGFVGTGLLARRGQGYGLPGFVEPPATVTVALGDEENSHSTETIASAEQLTSSEPLVPAAEPASSPGTASSDAPRVDTADGIPARLQTLLERHPEGVTARDVLRGRLASDSAEATVLLEGLAASGKLVRHEQHPQNGGRASVTFALPPA